MSDTEYDAITKIETLYHGTPEGGLVVETVQDAEPIVEANKALANMYDERTPFKGDGFHRVASIPLVIFFDLKKKGVLDDPKAFARWLNDRDNAAFRTRPGRV